MVSYWKTGQAVQAKVTTQGGAIVMHMEGEKYPFPCFPRSYLLVRNPDGSYPKFSQLKHFIKNEIFNDSWAMLEEGKTSEEIVAYLRKEILPRLYSFLAEQKLDMVPSERLAPAVKEIYRAFTKVAPDSKALRDMIVYIIQEDDAYRFRLQWLVGFMPTSLFRFFDPVKLFLKALPWLEHGEIIGDMKERQRLFRRVVETILQSPDIHKKVTALFREINWRKVKMSKADKYFFRGKYFKVDLDKFDY